MATTPPVRPNTRSRAAGNDTTPTPATNQGRGRGGRARGRGRGGAKLERQNAVDAFQLMGDQEPSVPAPVLPVASSTEDPAPLSPGRLLGGNLEEVVAALNNPVIFTPTPSPQPPSIALPAVAAPAAPPASQATPTPPPSTQPPPSQPAANEDDITPRPDVRHVRFADGVFIADDGEMSDAIDETMSNATNENSSDAISEQQEPRQSPGRLSKEVTRILNESSSLMDDIFTSLAIQLGGDITADQARRLYFALEDGGNNVSFDGVSSRRLALLFNSFTDIRAILDSTAERTNRLPTSIRKLYVQTHAQPRQPNQYNSFQAMEKATAAALGKARSSNPAGTSARYSERKKTGILEESLDVYKELSTLEQGNMPMHKRARSFESLCKSFRNASGSGEKNQFQSIVIAVGDSIHNDGGLVEIYESEGLDGFFLKMFKLNDSGITGLVRIFATQYRATSLQDMATAHTHKMLEDNKALLQQPETTNRKAVVTKITDAQLAAAALGDSPDDPEIIIVRGTPWGDRPDSDQKAYDDWLGIYFRSVLSHLDPSIEVEDQTTSPFKKLNQALVRAGRCAIDYPSRIIFPGEQDKDGKPSDGLRSIPRPLRREMVATLVAKPIKLVLSDRYLLNDSVNPIWVGAAPELTPAEMKKLEGASGKRSRDLGPDAWPIASARQFYLNGSVDCGGPEAIISVTVPDGDEDSHKPVPKKTGKTARAGKATKADISSKVSIPKPLATGKAKTSGKSTTKAKSSSTRPAHAPPSMPDPATAADDPFLDNRPITERVPPAALTIPDDPFPWKISSKPPTAFDPALHLRPVGHPAPAAPLLVVNPPSSGPAINSASINAPPADPFDMLIDPVLKRTARGDEQGAQKNKRPCTGAGIGATSTVATSVPPASFPTPTMPVPAAPPPTFPTTATPAPAALIQTPAFAAPAMPAPTAPIQTPAPAAGYTFDHNMMGAMFASAFARGDQATLAALMSAAASIAPSGTPAPTGVPAPAPSVPTPAGTRPPFSFQGTFGGAGGPWNSQDGFNGGAGSGGA